MGSLTSYLWGNFDARDHFDCGDAGMEHALIAVIVEDKEKAESWGCGKSVTRGVLWKDSSGVDMTALQGVPCVEIRRQLL